MGAYIWNGRYVERRATLLKNWRNRRTYVEIDKRTDVEIDRDWTNGQTENMKWIGVKSEV